MQTFFVKIGNIFYEWVSCFFSTNLLYCNSGAKNACKKGWGDMEKIASFCINHDTLMPGMYISRTDGDVITYDVRFVRPNMPPYLPTDAMHTIEHLVATYVRNSVFKDGIIYFGPMGCRTGFYFLTRGIAHADAIRLMREAMAFCADFEGEIPGATQAECGNWLEHDLPTARQWAASMAAVLDGYTEAQLTYPA